MTDTTDWWRELLAVLGVPNCKRLAQKIQASFSHPPRASEVKKMKDHCEAPPAPLCYHKESFQLPPNTIFTCWNIREVWRDKTIVYAHALQYWAEKSDLPTGGQPHWLAKSVKELQEEMKCYLSFSDREVFEGVAPPEEMPSGLFEGAESPSVMTVPTATSWEQPVKETPHKLAKERKCPKFPRWEKSPAPIPACGGCRAAPLPIKKSRVDLSTCGQLQPAHRYSAPRTYLPSTGIRGCPPVGTYSWVPGSNGLPEKSVTQRGPQNIPCPIANGNDDDSGGDDYECQPCNMRWGHWSHLLGHGDHLSGKSDSQWSWGWDSYARTHDRRHCRPHLKGKLIVYIRMVKQTEFANNCCGTAELAICCCWADGTFWWLPLGGKTMMP